MVPRNGMFIKKGEFVDGDGRVYGQSPELYIYPSLKKAQEAKKTALALYAAKTGKPFDGKILPVSYF